MTDLNIERTLHLLDRASICVAIVILVTYTVRLPDFIRAYVSVCLWTGICQDFAGGLWEEACAESRRDGCAAAKVQGAWFVSAETNGIETGALLLPVLS